jgi:hypothetical protein
VFALLLAGALGAIPLRAQTTESDVRQFELYIGDSLEVSVEPVDRLLNLDPELVAVNAPDPGRIVLRGLKYGMATIRVWSEGRPIVLRAMVLGHRPILDPSQDPRVRNGRPLSITYGTRYYGYRTEGPRSTSSSVRTHTGEARLNRGDLHGQGRLTLEEREGEVDVLQYDVLLERPQLGPFHQPRLHLGMVDVAWSRFTFFRDRFEGGRLELGTPRLVGGRQRLLLEVCYGEDVPDVVVPGSRTRLYAPTRDRLGGARLQWRPSSDVFAHAELGTRWGPGDETRGVGSIGTRGREAHVDWEGLLAVDGDHLAGDGGIRWARRGTALSASANFFNGPFRTLRGGRGLPGSRYLRLGARRDVGDRLRLNATTSWRRWEQTETSTFTVIPPPESELTVTPPPGSGPLRVGPAALSAAVTPSAIDAWLDNRYHSLGADYELTEAVLLRGWLKRGDNDIREDHWRRWRGGGEVGFRSNGGLERHGAWVGLRIGGENTNERITDGDRDDFTRRSVYLEPELGFSEWLSVEARLERRFFGDDVTDEPSDFVWRTQVVGRAPRFGPMGDGRFTLGYQEWEYLSLLDRKFNSGRRYTARVELGTRPWHGFRADMVAAWDQDPDMDLENGAIQIGLTHGFGAGRPAVERGRRYPRRTVRGLVFHDRNANGRRDPLEFGVPGVKVRLDDGREAVTGSDGFYRFGGVRADRVHVRVVPDPEVTKLVATTPVVRRVALAAVDRPGADFGLGPAPATLELLAFSDLDENGQLDEGEPLVSDLRLYLTGVDVQVRTTTAGATRQMLPLGRTVTCDWRRSSLPTDYSPLGRWEDLTVTATAGETVRWELPLRALRSVRGHVYVDRNGNGRWDRDEPPAGGAALRAGSRLAVVDLQGRFVLKGLPPGRVEITLLDSGRRPDWVLPRPFRVELDRGPEIRNGIEIGLRTVSRR